MIWNTPQRRHLFFFSLLCAQFLTVGPWLQAQTAPEEKIAGGVSQKTLELPLGSFICPGGFPTDLTVTSCAYKPEQRLHQWVTTSLTDEAMLGAIVYGTGAQIIQSPSEWGQTWKGYGQRVGVRYTQAAARGTAEYIVGAIIHDDPRHLSYKNDPHSHYGTKVIKCGKTGQAVAVYDEPTNSIVGKRIGHAFLDSVTVLHSTNCGTGARIPAFDRVIGIAAGSYGGGYPWYPAAENRLDSAAIRAIWSYASTLLGSFYTEFSPEITTFLAGGRKKK